LCEGRKTLRPSSGGAGAADPAGGDASSTGPNLVADA
jgi:hypothetical protein